jgi:hypothetical protein
LTGGLDCLADLIHRLGARCLHLTLHERANSRKSPIKEQSEFLQELFCVTVTFCGYTSFEHTRELQLGGSLTGANVTPELRAKLSGVNRTNTVVE